MSIDTWLENLRANVPTQLGRRLTLTNRSKKGHDGRPGGSRPRQRRLNLEALENRIMLTGTITAVTSAPDPSIFGQDVTFTATVKTDAGAIVNKGTVEFSIGASSSGPEALNKDGVATYDDSTLSPGTYPVTATYSGYEDVYTGSTGTESAGQVVDEAPTITSAAGASFTVGSAGSFTVTDTGYPTPTLSESAGTSLASLGLSFDASTGVLSGTPSPNTGGTYGLIFTASNGVGSNASQSFSLSILQAPAITSAHGATFVVGSPGNFTVTATGTPTPTLSESAATSLASLGLSFDASTGVLSGTPSPNTGGTYGLIFTASNGIGSDATQDFSLSIEQASAITSADSATFVAGSPGTFTVMATGTPTPTLSESSATSLASLGLSFEPSTGVLSGTPSPNTGGTYGLIFTASNGIGLSASQNFSLSILQAPAITSATVPRSSPDHPAPSRLRPRAHRRRL